MTGTPATPAPFARIKIRTSALVFWCDDVALVRRERADSVLYSTIGGNVEPAESLPHALRRELAEELALDVNQAEGENCSGSSTSASCSRATHRPANCT